MNNGIAIDIGSLNDVTIGNQKLHPFDTFRIYKQSNKLFYSMHKVSAPTGNPQQFNNVLPFQELKGGIGAAVNDFANGIHIAYEQLAVLSGIDRFSQNSSNTPADTPATLIKAAIASTQDSLKPLYSGWVDIMERMARSIAMVAQQLCVENDDESYGYFPIIGTKKMDAIKIAGETPSAEYGIVISALPTAEEQARVIEAAQGMTAGGKNGIPALSASEYLFIVSRVKTGAPIDDVRAYIAFKEQKREEQKAQQSQAMMKMDEEKSINIENTKAKNEKDKKKFYTDQDIRLEQAKAYFKVIAEQAIDKSWNFEQMKTEALKLGINIAQMNAQQGNEQQGSMPPVGIPQGAPPTKQQPAMQ
jgi:hypothetical protein